MTLADASEKTREILKWGSIILGSLLLIFIAIRIFSFIQSSFAPPPAPQVSYGKLNYPDFPNNASNNKFTYSINTLSGSLPTFPTQGKVFKMEENQPDLLALSKAQSKVENVGFDQSPTKISDSIYQWRDKSARIFTMNIYNSNFNMISDFLNNPNQPLLTEDSNTAKKTAENFLSTLNLLPLDIDSKLTNTSLFAIKNYGLVPATSLSNAQAILVSFFQQPLENLPIFYANPSVSPLNFLIGEPNGNPEVVDANFSYQKVSKNSSTYPIKDSSLAFEDLKKGKAYIASYTGPGKNISISNVLLGYYISEKKQDHLLPIVVFQGDNGFTAYVVAVKDEWVNK